MSNEKLLNALFFGWAAADKPQQPEAHSQLTPP